MVSSLSTAQAQALELNLWKKSLNIYVGNTFTNRLTIRNGGSQVQSVQLAYEGAPAIRFLSEIPGELALSPGEVQMVPLKGFVHRQSDSPIHEIRFRISTGTKPVQEVSFQVIVEEKGLPALALHAPDEPILLYSGTEPAQLPLQIIHHRTRRENVSIEVASFPEIIDRSRFPLSLALAPRQDTLLSIPVSPERYWSASTPYQLTVTLRDSAGSVLGNVMYKLMVATPSKRFRDLDTRSSEGYGISAGVTKLSNNQWAREARIFGRDSVGRAQVDFQLHYLDYVSDGFRQLQNSHLSIRTNRAQLRLGSQYDYHELALLGRGLKLNLHQTTHQWTFWAVNTNPNWLNPEANAWAGTVYSARYDHPIATLPGSSWSLSSSYFTNSATQRTGFLNFGAVQLHQSERHWLELLGSQSVEYARSSPDRGRVTGWAGQLNYSFRKPGFAWIFRSYLSSPVYAGLQKGATLVQTQTVWQPTPSTTLIARLNHIRYNQVLFTSPVDRYRLRFGNTVAELTLDQRFEKFSASIRPYWHAQTDYSNPFSQRGQAFRLSPAVAYRDGTRQHFDLSYDIGTFFDLSRPTVPAGLLSQRILSNWAMGPFHLFGYWQKGPYFLSDLRTDRPDRVQMASVTPMVDFSLFNRRFMGSVGLNYLYDALSSGSRCLAVGRVRFDITPDFWLKVEGNATPYSQQSELAYSQYRLELTRQFSQLSLKKRAQLRLSFFEDVNANGSKDPGESWIDSLLVTVNENTLLTNSKGTILYRNLPPGAYTVSAVNISAVGDPVQYRDKITVVRSVNRQVPLQRTFRISGQLRCQTNVYTQACQFSRFTLEVLRDQRPVTTTTPQPDGGFAFHLAPGSYTLLVRDYTRQPQTVVQTIPFLISPGGQHPTFDLAVDGSTRSVEIKRFTAK
ncbi:hypothetical protein [Larkinella ripae]